MIAVDSSVWIDFFRGTGSPEAALLSRLLGRDTLLVPDLVLCEVLRGAATDEEATQLRTILNEFDVVSVVDEEIATFAADNYRQLRGRGLTIRSTIDLLVATWCIENGHHILHRDRDFDVMERHLGLQVLHP